MRSLLAGAAFLALLTSSDAALACADTSEPGRWMLDRKVYFGQNGLPFLSPGNDSRLNLLLLVMDSRPATTPKVGGSESAEAKIDLDAAVLFARSDLETVCRSGAFPVDPAKPAPSSAFADGEGTRCVSFEDGKQAFTAAVRDESGLSAAERGLLADARDKIAPSCLGKKDGAATTQDPLAGAPAASAAAREFSAYLIGADAFYEGDFDRALDRFGKLAGSKNAWLRESARYMVARSLLNKAQIGAFADFDGTAQPKIADRASLAAAEKEFQAYLSAYPAGRYAGSARGLLRRVYWLGDDKARLAAEYAWQIAHVSGPQANLDSVDLVQEIDSKYLGARDDQSREPILLAALDLMRMRSSGAGEPGLSAAELDAQAPAFAGRDDLFAFLKAARAHYADRDTATALRLLGAPAAAASSHLAFSREMLRGQALMADGDFQAAADHWRALLASADKPWRKDAVELGLAMSYERAGSLNKVFLPETRLSTPRIRAVLLRQSAGPILLRMAVADPRSTPEERRLARFVLLYKEATRSQYSNFLRDFSPEGLAKDDEDAPNFGQIPKSASFLWSGADEPFKCPTLKAVVGELAANPRATRALLCLGDFLRITGLDGFDATRPPADELGGAKPIFPGEPFSRGEVYKQLIADPKTPEAERAYALYRAVNCYAPAGANGCGGSSVELAQRRAWFKTLKSKYGATPWAKSLQYFW